MFGEQIKNYLTIKFRTNYLLAIFSSLIIILFVCILFFLAIEVFTQQDQFKFDHITIQQGLNDNHVYSIGQDKQGFMWLSTLKVLSRFDDYNIKIYSYTGRSQIF